QFSADGEGRGAGEQVPGERCGQTTFPGRQQVGTLSGASSQARRTLPAYAPPLRGPARLDRSLEPRRSAVLISALATGPPAGVGGGSDRFWARELRVSQHFSTFYEPSVQAMDTQLGAPSTVPILARPFRAA